MLISTPHGPSKASRDVEVKAEKHLFYLTVVREKHFQSNEKTLGFSLLMDPII